jgi:hypothetical protein
MIPDWQLIGVAQQLHACCAYPSASAANQLSDGKNKAQLLISTAFLYFKDGILMNHLKALQKVVVLALVFAGYANSADAAIVILFPPSLHPATRDTKRSMQSIRGATAQIPIGHPAHKEPAPSSISISAQLTPSPRLL